MRSEISGASGSQFRQKAKPNKYLRHLSNSLIILPPSDDLSLDQQSEGKPAQSNMRRLGTTSPS